MTTLAWTAIAVGAYLALALPFAFLIGRSVRRNTEDPEPEDWLELEDVRWDFPRRDAA